MHAAAPEIMRIAIIGTGISGLVAAHLLRRDHDVVVYESEERAGGHSHTHRIEQSVGHGCRGRPRSAFANAQRRFPRERKAFGRWH